MRTSSVAWHLSVCESLHRLIGEMSSPVWLCFLVFVFLVTTPAPAAILPASEWQDWGWPLTQSPESPMIQLAQQNWSIVILMSSVSTDCREEMYPCTRMYSVHRPIKQCVGALCFYRWSKIWLHTDFSYELAVKQCISWSMAVSWIDTEYRRDHRWRKAPRAAQKMKELTLNRSRNRKICLWKFLINSVKSFLNHFHDWTNKEIKHKLGNIPSFHLELITVPLHQDSEFCIDQSTPVNLSQLSSVLVSNCRCWIMIGTSATAHYFLPKWTRSHLETKKSRNKQISHVKHVKRYSFEWKKER